MTRVKVPIKYLCNLNPEVLSENTDPDFSFNYVDIGSVTLRNGIEEYEHIRFEGSPSRARKVIRKNDVIVSTVRTYLKAVARLPEEDGDWVVSTGFAVLRARSEVHPDYLFRAIQSEVFIAEVQRESTGVSYPAINPTKLARIPIPCPEKSAQIRIAKVLDEETTRIDRLIEKKRRFADLVQEAQGSLIANAVSGALFDQNEKRDAGWLGQIPKHWKFQRAKVHFRERIGRSESGDEELLTVSHITGVTSRADKNVHMFLAESNEGYKLVKPNDIVINTMWAWMGAMGVSQLKGLISPSYGIYEPISDAFVPEYIDLLIRSDAFVAEATRRSKGIHSSRLRLYPDAFLDTRLPVPPTHEQEEIVTIVQTRLKKDRELLALNEKTIDLLLEKRTALITAAVTGQLDVTSSAFVQVSANDNVPLLLAVEIIRQHERSQKFGRVKFQKIVYLAEAHCGVHEFGGQYQREAAGPLDRILLNSLEGQLADTGLYRAEQAEDGGAVTYKALGSGDDKRDVLTRALGERADRFRNMLANLRDMDTHAVEAITTLYAIWNDFLIDGEAPDDRAIIKGVLEDWHPEKKDKFRVDELQTWLGWMRRNDFIPKGQGPKTSTGRLFV